MSVSLNDPAKQFADFTMMQVSGAFGPTNDGRDRSKAPYYFFGALNEQNQTPPTRLPAVQWRQADWDWDNTRVVAGFGTTGSLGSWMTKYEVKIFGSNRAEVFDEMWYIQACIVELQDGRPPIRDFHGTWLEPGEAKQNRKETLLLTFTAPILVPVIPIQSVILTAISASISEAALTSSLLPPVTGSYPADRTVVIT